MGKVQNKPQGSGHHKRSQRVGEVHRWVRRRLALSRRMTPQQRAAADAEWELVKRSINGERARAAARRAYTDE